MVVHILDMPDIETITQLVSDSDRQLVTMGVCHCRVETVAPWFRKYR